MSLLLKGIDLPKDGETCYLAISKNASRYVLYEAIDGDFEKLIEARGIEAIQIERPRGNLKDEDDIIASLSFTDLPAMVEKYGEQAIIDFIKLAPTIIEAEE